MHMATYRETIKAYNDAIAQGLDEDAALEAAGINNDNIYEFEINEIGNPRTNTNFGKLEVAGFNKPTGAALDRQVGADDPPARVSTSRAAPLDEPPFDTRTTFTNTITTTTTTGGGSTTEVRNPTVKLDTPASTAAQQQADAANAARNAKVAQLKAEGKSFAQYIKDPEVKALAAQRDAAQKQADDLKVPVPGTGGVTVIETPNTTTVETVYSTSSPNFLTQNAGNEDQTVQLSELEQIPAATNGDVVSVTVGQEDPYEQSRLDAEAAFDADFAENQAQEDPYEQSRLDAEAAFNEDFGGADTPEPVEVTYDAFGNEIPPGSTEEGVGAFGGEGPPIEGAKDVELTEEERTRLEAEAAFNQDAAAQAEIEQQEAEQAAAKAAALDLARAQNTIANQRSNKNNADWRVKLRLAPLADYLYKATNPGILSPLLATDGVLFPYTPTIQTAYKANYSAVDITHSNYKAYFYQGSAVEPVIISCPFTAQSTAEADYLLAVIHFFKSATKMFYGQDPQRGTPPPLVYLTGLGQFQFNEHPCVLTSFTYDLPADVDYVRARSPNVNNTNMLQQRESNNSIGPGTSWGGGLLGGFVGGAINRLASSKLANGQSMPAGGENTKPPPPTLASNTLPTYVPTKMTISITLLPVVSRQAQSQRFSVRQYANGDLLKGGMW